jgi:CRISPR/Cas system Type II protein with McrA/HNH and RuvC-like nuclease domain
MTVSKLIRFEALKRDGFTCQYCGAKAPEVRIEIDHIVPVSKGGKDDLENLVTCCYNCNGGKRNIFLSDNYLSEKQKNAKKKIKQKMINLTLTEEENKSINEYIDINGYKLGTYVKKMLMDFIIEAVK